ncbi:uncharacterized protein DUF559 [Frondihabitans sp. PhB188]|uniref:type IV toxin-antitoxin system AbiEi family antitoxin domain-containing protein n=1 Tax=Frondihabitans sp. PhB188 TaxID=2485200 RepID=UPI000F49BD5C|nr:type IV toxin-antitoxin system AbiEi family antitoxin domain-containing protein [Frondihabitans sp. PhB188]ROQ36673.1 uncharacterized protein DUF559 [Frondihabitans sp. PhB188]
MDNFERILRSAGGIATTRGLFSGGVAPRHLAAAVADGRLLRVRRGLYALPDASPAALLAVRAGGRLAGLSAAASYGLWDGWDDRLHVVVPRNSAMVPKTRREQLRSVRTIEGRTVVVHWNDDPRDVAWAWRVSPERCLRQVLRWADLETATATVESALTTGLVEQETVYRIASGLTPSAGRAIERCRPGAQSGLETIVRLRLERLGYVVERQASLSRVGHVDLRLLGTRVAVEVDGFAFHGSRAQFGEDRRRDAEAAAQGIVTLRFTAEHVRDQWPWVERMVLDAVANVAS